MKRIHALIILISLIVTVVILIAYIVGNIRYKLDDSMSPEVSSVLSEDNIPSNLGQTVFALQLFASNNFKKINRLQSKLERKGQNTRITKLKRDGEIIYRLRAGDLLPEDEAIALGEQLKQDFSEIDGYWLEEQAGFVQAPKRETEFDQFVEETEKPEKVSDNVAEESVATNTEVEPPEAMPKTTPSQANGDKNFEIQILASSDYDAIIRHQEYLDKQGFPNKVLKLVVDGKTIYRLRLQERLNQSEAVALGKKLISETYFKDFWLQDLQGNEVYPTSKPQVRPNFGGDYEIQLLANPSREFVEEKLAELNKTRFRGKIVSAVVKGTRYYRLRTLNTYDYDEAQKVAEELKNEVEFVKDSWIVKATPQSEAKQPQQESSRSISQSQSQQVEQPETQQQNNDMITSLDPRYAPRKILYTIDVPRNNIDIRTGPGRHYELDELGKLMKGVEIYVVEERNGYLRFRLIKNKYDWTGWVAQKDVK